MHRIVVQCSNCLHMGAIIEAVEFDETEKNDILLHVICATCKHTAIVSLKEWLANIFNEEAES